MEMMMAKKIIVPIMAPAIAPPLQPQCEEQTPPQQTSPISPAEEHVLVAASSVCELRPFVVVAVGR
ncbi:hypothetical protein pdam_00015106 [Pocillopora damicornis]|uniref:Uncharacterized protein n=1 Tax=Pocillopora damicornis TaxID=46731 RepID=A0A3M6UMM6_POCDA|nr:hypothetical protein pdam_00015106 [Pocillopora damicornis]